MFLLNQIHAADTVDISGLEKSTSQAIGAKTFTDIASFFSQDLLNLVFVIIGLLFFANLVMAGWDYMLSSGDQKKLSTANSRLTNSLFGLLLAVTAYLIVRVVLAFLGLKDFI